MDKELQKLSRKMSYFLRHRPEVGNLVLEPGGWVKLTDLARACGVTTSYLKDVVEGPSDKVRYVIDGDRIRAAQGHTVQVDLQLDPREPPDMLFHGTHTKALTAIFEQGLSPMSRHHVHLATDTATAKTVGARRGTPVIIQVDSSGAHKNGVKFYLADNGVWLSEAIPPRYLTAFYPL